MSLYGRTDSNTNKTKAGIGVVASSVTPTVVFVDETEAALNVNRTRGITGPGWWSYFTYTDNEGNTRHKAEHLITIVNPDTTETQADDTIAADVASAITISVQPTNQTTIAGRVGSHSATYGGTTLAGQANQTYTLTGLAGSAAGTGAGFTIARSSSGALQSTALTVYGAGFVAGETITILGSLVGGVNTTDNIVLTVHSVQSADATFSVTAAATTGTLTYQWQLQTATSTRWSNISSATSASLALTSLAIADTGKKYRVKLASSAGATEVISNLATLTVTT